MTAIANKVNEQGILSAKGTKWTSAVVWQILTNPKMCGDTLHQRGFTVDHISKKHVKNHGELPMFLIENTHEGIVSKEIFEAAKAEFARRAACGGLRETEGLPFRKKIYCEKCGRRYHRKTGFTRTEGYYPQWQCLGYDKRIAGVENRCRMPNIRERTLMVASAKALGIKEFDPTLFAEKVERIIFHENLRLTFVFHDGTEILVGYELRKRWKDVRIIGKST